MNECCWYETNVSNLWHYAKNRLKYLFDDRYSECMNEDRQRAGVSDNGVIEQSVSASTQQTIPTASSADSRRTI